LIIKYPLFIVIDRQSLNKRSGQYGQRSREDRRDTIFIGIIIKKA